MIIFNIHNLLKNTALSELISNNFINFIEKYFMKTISTTQAGKEIEKFIYETSAYHEPIQIKGKGKNSSNGILISEDDWMAITETLYLLAIPGMRESIVKGLNTPIDKTSDKLVW